MSVRFPLVCEDHLHFSNWGSRKPMTNWSTSTMNLSPALAFPPIGSRSLRCSIIDRTKSSSSSCAVRAKACTVCGSTVGYGKNDGDGADAIERIKSFPPLNRWLLRKTVSAFTAKWRKPQGGLALYRLDQLKVRSESLRWKVRSQKYILIS
jgi:hypothetical protein